MRLKGMTNLVCQRRRLRAMTIMEVLVATGVGSIVLATVMSLSLFSTRSSMAVANYTDLDAKSRYALDVISKEVRQATAVSSYQSSTNSKSLTLTNSAAGVSSTLTWNGSARTLVLQRTGQAALTALTQCDQWNVALYQRTPLVTATNILFYPATNTSGTLDLRLCKMIDMSWKCSRSILGQKANTENVQAAQLVLRNKQ
jgi:Tfp pilus assembly protein PilW